MFVSWPFHRIHLLSAFNPACAFISKTFQHINSETTSTSQLHLVNVSSFCRVLFSVVADIWMMVTACLMEMCPSNVKYLTYQNVLVTKLWTSESNKWTSSSFEKHNNLLVAFAFEVGFISTLKFIIFQTKVLDKWWCVIDLESHVVKLKYMKH